MVMEREQKEATHGHATTTDVTPELGAAARTGTGSRPRPAPVCARAVRRGAEDRRRDIAAGTSPPAVARPGLLEPRDPDTVSPSLTDFLADRPPGMTGHRL